MSVTLSGCSCLCKQSSVFLQQCAGCGAGQVDDQEVWSELGHTQLSQDLVDDAIEAYLRANDSSRSPPPPS